MTAGMRFFVTYAITKLMYIMHVMIGNIGWKVTCRIYRLRNISVTLVLNSKVILFRTLLITGHSGVASGGGVARGDVRRSFVFLFTIISPYLWDPYVSPSRSSISHSTCLRFSFTERQICSPYIRHGSNVEQAAIVGSLYSFVRHSTWVERRTSNDRG